MRIYPYRTGENVISGTVISFQDINELKKLEATLQGALDYANAIIDSVREPLVVLDGKLGVISASGAFYREFKTTPAHTEGKFLYDIQDGIFDIPELRKLLEEVTRKDTTFRDYSWKSIRAGEAPAGCL